MSVDVESRVRQLVGEMVDAAPLAGEAVPLARRMAEHTQSSSRTRVRLALATAAVLAIGLGWLTARTDGPSLTTETADDTSPVPTLRSFDGSGDLAADEWIVPSWLPEGFQYDVALSAYSRWVRFESQTDSVTVDIRPDQPQSATEANADVLEIGGVEWLRLPSIGLARVIDSGWLEVRAPGFDDSELVSLIESLIIVEVEDLPRPPLLLDEPGVVVGETVWLGEPVDLRVLSDGLTYSVGGSCCTKMTDGLLVRMTGASTAGDQDDAVMDGIVDASVALVRLVLSGGGTVDLEPQDRDDLFPVNFVIGTFPSTQPDPFYSVAEIIAFDADGTELGRSAGASGMLEIRVDQ